MDLLFRHLDILYQDAFWILLAVVAFIGGGAIGIIGMAFFKTLPIEPDEHAELHLDKGER